MAQKETTLVVMLEKGSRNTPMVSSTSVYTLEEFFRLPKPKGWPYGFFFYTTTLNSARGMSLLSKKRLEREFSQYKNTDMYEFIMSRHWRR